MNKMTVAQINDYLKEVHHPAKDDRDIVELGMVLTADGGIVERFRYDPWGVQLKEVAIDTCGVEAVDSLGVILDTVIVDTLAIPEPWQMGGVVGAANGVITKQIYQQHYKEMDNNGRGIWNSDMAEASGEFAGNTVSYLEASRGPKAIGLFGHDYGESAIYIKGSICIGLTTGRCTIDIDPYAPMVPSKLTFYVPL